MNNNIKNEIFLKDFHFEIFNYFCLASGIHSIKKRPYGSRTTHKEWIKCLETSSGVKWIQIKSRIFFFFTFLFCNICVFLQFYVFFHITAQWFTNWCDLKETLDIGSYKTILRDQTRYDKFQNIIIYLCLVLLVCWMFWWT